VRSLVCVCVCVSVDCADFQINEIYEPNVDQQMAPFTCILLQRHWSQSLRTSLNICWPLRNQPIPRRRANNRSLRLRYQVISAHVRLTQQKLLSPGADVHHFAAFKTQPDNVLVSLIFKALRHTQTMLYRSKLQISEDSVCLNIVTVYYALIYEYLPWSALLKRCRQDEWFAPASVLLPV